MLAYDHLDDAIVRANDSPDGLGGTVWTSDVERGIAVASRIESGTVWVNKHLDLPFNVPFGSAKQSGIGRQQRIEAMELHAGKGRQGRAGMRHPPGERRHRPPNPKP
ncbi:MAG: aldehyde dehydrogenase family protein [Sphingomonas sp.]|uniref:aldehyde dehydrogenase family protein n=1 Tax=Sphingomonas sp. TaxID=28214 RepID=UPI00260B1F30|nr:aldehyde dehydrogenase family protein [Sphingomonas sp.]MDK2768293.1 aldehyde dehydrogenase family protein [Sphingomonas sp.]